VAQARSVPGIDPYIEAADTFAVRPLRHLDASKQPTLA
jgi:hypothetical protein